MMDAQLLGGRYRLECEIARGAIGAVWRAFDTMTGDAVAVKVLLPEVAGCSDIVVGLLGEADVLAGLDHPAVVRVRDMVTGAGMPALVMDLVPGIDLSRILRADGTLAPARAAAIGAEAADALAYVHERGIIHVDVKPSNLLLADDGHVRLIDFGVARRAADRWTQKLATPEYMAPEIAAGQAPTPATDVYALGIVLYELVCGRSPFRGGTSAEIMRRHARCVAVPAPGVPPQMWAVIEPCLRPDPLLRPAAAQVAAALRAVAAGLVGVAAVAPLPPDAVTCRPRVAETTRFGEPPAALAPAAAFAPAAAVPRRGRLRTRLLVGAAVVVVATFLTGGGVAVANGAFGGDGAGRPPGTVVNGPATSPSTESPPAPSATPSGPADDPAGTPSDGSDRSDGSDGSDRSRSQGPGSSRKVPPGRGSAGDLIGGPMPQLPRR